MVEDVAAQEVGYLLDEALRKCQDQVIFQFSPPHKRRIEARPLAASYCLLWTKSWGVQYYIPLKDPAWVGYPVMGMTICRTDEFVHVSFFGWCSYFLFYGI